MFDFSCSFVQPNNQHQAQEDINETKLYLIDATSQIDNSLISLALLMIDGNEMNAFWGYKNTLWVVLNLNISLSLHFILETSLHVTLLRLSKTAKLKH